MIKIVTPLLSLLCAAAIAGCAARAGAPNVPMMVSPSAIDISLTNKKRAEFSVNGRGAVSIASTERCLGIADLAFTPGEVVGYGMIVRSFVVGRTPGSCAFVFGDSAGRTVTLPVTVSK